MADRPVRVLVTQRIHPAADALLDHPRLEVDRRSGSAPIARDELLRRVRGRDALLCMPTDRVDEAVMAAGPLRLVASHSVGLDHVDLDAARRLGVAVTHTPGVLTEATADLAMALVLAVARRVVEGDAFLRAGRFEGWRPDLLVGRDLHGATMGIVGLGRIGRAVARRAEAFGMTVIHCSRRSGLPLDELMARSDVISLHCPLTPETHHLVDRTALAHCTRRPILVNTARGPVVDEDALVEALEAGRLAGAGLDVHEREPAVHPALVGRSDVVLLPHLGSATDRTRRRMGELAVGAVLALAEGRPLPHRVA